MTSTKPSPTQGNSLTSYTKNVRTSTLEPYHKLNDEQIELIVSIIILARLLTAENFAKLLNVSEANINRHVRNRKKAKQL